MQFCQTYGFYKFAFEKDFAVLFCEFSSDKPQPPEHESLLETKTQEPAIGQTKTQFSS